MARTERETLNELIEICRDGARGFRLAADHVADPVLKQLFADTARQRELFAAELLPYAYRLGGGWEGSGTARGALHRGWIIVKDAMQHDERAILHEAMRGEIAATSAYADAVTSMLPPNARPVIERQYGAIQHVKEELGELTLPVA